MSVVRILAISVETGLGEGVEHLLGAQGLRYENQDGFERLELLEPADGRSTSLFVTRWVDERIAAFGGPESLNGGVWNYRVALDSST